MNILQIIFFPSHDLSSFPFFYLTALLNFLNNLFCLLIFLWFLKFFLLSILMVIISQELTRVNPDRNIFSIKCGTNIYFFPLQRFGPSPSSISKYLLNCKDVISLVIRFNSFSLNLFPGLIFNVWICRLCNPQLVMRIWWRLEDISWVNIIQHFMISVEPFLFSSLSLKIG